MSEDPIEHGERWTPERRRARTREALLDAAVTVFARRGFAGASLDEIAETAGYTRGAIYKHFADKEEMLQAASERLNERALTQFAELPHADAPIDAIDVGEIVERWHQMIAADSDFFVVGLEFQLYAARNPELRERARAQRQASTELVASFMRQHSQRIGMTMPMPAEDLATIFLTATDGFNQAALVDPDVTRLYGVFLELMIRAVGEASNSPS